ncbi:FAD-dependent oxidoreductase [Diplocloster modestus]|uniref:FAD-dependent oxidoreductase n=1 Tax=Diplocloster modestus TaxID=2850322 RepID=A0ABS6K6U3_9FIRM|nr:FAD-dependent oxidoreductase [Diplocloster modestus]MBU9726245.1 FAD-dependent oxidoreductase [Diplocloster modestus]
MGEDKFDVIIVGGGLAGSTAAYILAQEGLEVLVIERGNYSGSKNMTGGRLYGHSLEKIIPQFAKEAPVERRISKERFSLLTEDSAVTLEYGSAKLGTPGCESYSVLRAGFDRWLAEKAEEEGAMYIYGIRVDDLIVRDGRVCGVIAGDEEMEADLVILADGVNSLLAQKIGMKEELLPSQSAVGAKEVIQLDAATIEQRFQLNPGEGLAWIFQGDCTDGRIGDGFLYTNKDTVSLGVLTTIQDIDDKETTIPQLVDRLKNHPAVKPLIEGGKLLEYSAHLVPEGGYSMVPTLYQDGVLLAGDAASLVINLGFMIRGMDLAIESGRLAAQTAVAAKEKGDFSAETLASYQQALEDSFVMKDLKFYDGYDKVIEDRRLYQDCPAIADRLFADLFVVDGTGTKDISKKIVPGLIDGLEKYNG